MGVQSTKLNISCSPFCYNDEAKSKAEKNSNEKEEEREEREGGDGRGREGEVTGEEGGYI